MFSYLMWLLQLRQLSLWVAKTVFLHDFQLLYKRDSIEQFASIKQILKHFTVLKTLIPELIHSRNYVPFMREIVLNNSRN